MYLEFFGLNEKPFAITPDPRYLYLSQRHAEALAHLVYGINESGGFVQLTGEVGTGKTTIVRSLLAQVPKDAEIALILNPRMTAPEFLVTICEELGIGVPDSAIGSLKELVDILNAYLLKAHARGRRVVLVVDEAQNLTPDVLEQVRLLTNLETNTQKLLQIILIGQPELRELLGRTELRQLAQRITGRYHLDPLSREETAAYVRHRLRVAGATSDIFGPGAIGEVFRLSGGIPRVVNVICDRALLGAYTQDRHRVTGALVRRAAAEVFGRRITPQWVPWAATATAVGLVLAAGLGVRTLWLAGSGEPAPAPVVAAAPADPVAPPPPAVVSPPLATLLGVHGTETDTDSAFGKLFALWQAGYAAGPLDPCAQAARQGLECLVQRGSFGQLRLYNRPAILMLSDESGAAHHVVLTALTEAAARVELGGVGREVSIAELSRYWFGDFVLLWRPQNRPVRPLSVGMRGEEVRRLREELQQARGAPAGDAASDVFDAELSRLVMEFQRQNRLAVDGIAGAQTQLVLNSALGGSDSPLLMQPTTHGS
jgi:general secretion pathway protein A